jgi:hypothetical protein
VTTLHGPVQDSKLWFAKKTRQQRATFSDYLLRAIAIPIRTLKVTKMLSLPGAG